MTDTDIELEVVEEGGAVILRASGELDMVTAPALRKQLLEAARTYDRVILDFRTIRFIDSSGLNAVVAGLKLLRHKGGSLALVAESRRVTKVFDLSGLNRLITIHTTVSDALAEPPVAPAGAETEDPR